MRTKIHRLAMVGILTGGLLGTGLIAPSHAAGTTQVEGGAVPGPGGCTNPPAGFDSYPGLPMTGDLKGCLYTQAVTSKQTPSGGWIETGHETFVGTMKGVFGTFRTNYRFQGKYETPDFLVEIHGRCQHPIVAGSGTGVFEGATGRINFKDLIGETIVYDYTGHITLG